MSEDGPCQSDRSVVLSRRVEVMIVAAYVNDAVTDGGRGHDAGVVSFAMPGFGVSQINPYVSMPLHPWAPVYAVLSSLSWRSKVPSGMK